MKVNQSCIGGNQDFLGVLYRAKFRVVRSFVYSMAHDPRLQSQAEDIAQTVFLRLLVKLGRGGFADVTATNWQTPANSLRLQAWLFGAALLVVSEFRRRQGREPQNRSALDDETASVRAAASETCFSLQVQECLDNCSPAQRIVIDLKIQGHTAQEISRRIGRTTSTVRGHLATVRQRLHSELFAAE